MDHAFDVWIIKWTDIIEINNFPKSRSRAYLLTTVIGPISQVVYSWV